VRDGCKNVCQSRLRLEAIPARAVHERTRVRARV
jgi:hypothetical protein